MTHIFFVSVSQLKKHLVRSLLYLLIKGIEKLTNQNSRKGGTTHEN